jgi:hypothetical protein
MVLSGRYWLKMKNPEASAVKREAEEDRGNPTSIIPRAMTRAESRSITETQPVQPWQRTTASRGSKMRADAVSCGYNFAETTLRAPAIQECHFRKP